MRTVMVAVRRGSRRSVVVVTVRRVSVEGRLRVMSDKLIYGVHLDLSLVVLVVMVVVMMATLWLVVIRGVGRRRSDETFDKRSRSRSDLLDDLDRVRGISGERGFADLRSFDELASPEQNPLSESFQVGREEAPKRNVPFPWNLSGRWR
jgi:hypothetical protein